MAEAHWMQRCLELAEQGRGRTAPNPMVGAVLVRDGECVAEGWHHAPGLAHAELDALRHANGASTGSTMYVNLEPCCHHGRTPPCTDAIIHHGIRKVVVGMIDPDSRMRGKGIEQLEAAGIEVEVGVDTAACRSLNAAYVSAVERGRPIVTLKAAITLDGRIADAGGRSQWITGPEAREAGHRLRDRHDAVLIGSGTLHADDPSLNTRVADGRDALPVILDTKLSCPAAARVLTAGRRPVLYCGEDAPKRDVSAEIARVALSANGGLDVHAVLADLVSRRVHSVLVEGGAQVHRSFLDAGLVDRIELFVAPKVLAGGPGWVGGAPLDLADAPGFRVLESETLGGDLRVVLERTACSVES